MSEFPYVIHHIPGVENHCGDLLPRLRPVGGGAADSGKEVPVCVRFIAVVAPTDVDYSFPSMSETWDHQDSYTDGIAILDSTLGSVGRGENGLYRIDFGGMQVIWVPRAERSLQMRLMVCIQLQKARHRGICATMHRYCGEFCCDTCIYGTVLNVLECRFKALLQRMSSLFPSREPLESVTVEFWFALATSMELMSSWTLIALFSFLG